MRAARFSVNFVLTVVLGAVALATSVALLVPAARSLGSGISPINAVEVVLRTPPQRSYVFDRNGDIMTTLFTIDRAPVQLKAVPKQLINAVIAIEDRKFYEHNGVDIGGTIRALTRNVDAGKIEQGGSTITEQLVKNALSVGSAHAAAPCPAKPARLCVAANACMSTIWSPIATPPRHASRLPRRRNTANGRFWIGKSP